MLRRAALKALVGGAVAAPALARAEVAKLAGGLPAPLTGVGSNDRSIDALPVPPLVRALLGMRDKIGDAHWQSQHLPPSIAGRKSWSTAFKMHCHESDMRAINALIERAERDQAFADRLGKMLGVA